MFIPWLSHHGLGGLDVELAQYARGVTCLVMLNFKKKTVVNIQAIMYAKLKDADILIKVKNLATKIIAFMINQNPGLISCNIISYIFLQYVIVAKYLSTINALATF